MSPGRWCGVWPGCSPLSRAGFGLSRVTAYRYVEEAVRLLSEQAPELQDALERAAADGMPHLILDGTIISTDRLSETKTSVKGKEIDS